MLSRDTGSGPRAMHDPDRSLCSFSFWCFLTVCLETYKNLKFPKRLRFKEKNKVTLNTSYMAVFRLCYPLQNKVPFNLNLYINWQIAGCKCSGCKSSH